MLEECGEKLLPALLTCTQHPQPEVRAAAASLLATRRPHTPEMIEAIAPLINDSEPLARIQILECLKQFGDLVLPLVDPIYEIVQRERAKKDQVPRILAMGALLHIDRVAWEEELMPALTTSAHHKQATWQNSLLFVACLNSTGLRCRKSQTCLGNTDSILESFVPLEGAPHRGH